MSIGTPKLKLPHKASLNVVVADERFVTPGGPSETLRAAETAPMLIEARPGFPQRWTGAG